jgi:2'-5' RNA ligase
VRLFVAVPLPDPLAARLEAAAAALAVAGLRTTAREHLHVTVHFLGAVEPARVPALTAALAAACAEAEPFSLAFAAVAPAPPGRPRMLWARAQATPHYTALAHAVAAAAAGAAPGARPPRTTSPHVTLARARGRASEGVRWPAPAALAGATLAVSACALVRSDLGPGGPAHTVLATFPLRGGQSPRRR